jgi:DNA-binding response OmpR family regulator
MEPVAAQPTVPRLLVVEDDPDQCRMLCDRLRLYGYAVAWAGDGPAALEMLQTDSYNGLLLDLNLPTMPGHQVFQKTRHAYPHLPVLIMSASQSGIRKLSESEPTACTYLLKPYNSSQLKQALVKSFGPRPQAV